MANRINTVNTSSEDVSETESTPRIDLKDVRSKVLSYCKSSGVQIYEVTEAFTKYLKQLIEDNQAINDYNVIIIFDPTIMVKSDADNVYRAVKKFGEPKKKILLIIYSMGGDAGSAYLIGKLLREYTKEKFIVAVPREAKSAATLLCCAADEIHMGNLSELGPIDPQIDNTPALGLKKSIEHIAQLVKDNPQSSELFAKYLNLSLKPIYIGYYERVAESALQYAERLLKTHESLLSNTPNKIANTLVYEYKDHSFVIDKAEAQDIFGSGIVKCNTSIYNFSNSIYEFLSNIRWLTTGQGYNFIFIGDIESEPIFYKR